VGIGFTVIVTSEKDAVQGPFESVQRKTFAPNPIAVIVVVGEVGLVIVPLPETILHVPVPATIGLFPAIAAVGELEQIV
jgi:hypothetical protein